LCAKFLQFFDHKLTFGASGTGVDVLSISVPDRE
jgi:hypothetical protein